MQDVDFLSILPFTYFCDLFISKKIASSIIQSHAIFFAYRYDVALIIHFIPIMPFRLVSLNIVDSQTVFI